MDVKKLAAGAATVSLLGLGGLGAAAGLAQADPQKPNPGNPGHSDTNPGNSGDRGGPHGAPPAVTGPGVNAGVPGNPLPPGLGYLPPPGHGGPMPQDRVEYPEVPVWVITPVLPPVDAPLQPELPDWADGFTIVWNPDLSVWGVWDPTGNVFVRL
jgi:hypothetical protein